MLIIIYTYKALSFLNTLLILSTLLASYGSIGAAT